MVAEVARSEVEERRPVVVGCGDVEGGHLVVDAVQHGVEAQQLVVQGIWFEDDGALEAVDQQGWDGGRADVGADVDERLVGARPREAVFTLDGSRAYVTAENGNSISVVDTHTHTVIGTIALPRDNAGLQLKPKGIVVSHDGKRLYVATGRGNCVAAIDVPAQKVVQLIPTGQRPWGIAFSADETKLYTANGLSNDVSVIDVAKGSVITTIKAGNGPWGIVVTR